MYTRFVLLLFVSILVGVYPAQAQERNGDPLAELRASYENFQFEVAARLAEDLVQQQPSLSIDQLIEVHTLWGLIEYSQNEEQAARRQFEAALTLNPDLGLDSVLVSPKILSFFEEVRADFVSAQPGSEPNPGEVRYMVVADPRPQALMRTFLIPGWGQWYQGDKRMGSILIGLWAGTLGGAGLAHQARSRAEEAYQAETNPDRIADRYQTFNNRHKARNALLLGAAGVWVFSYLDVLRSEPAPPQDARLSLLPTWQDRGPHLTIQYRF